MSSVATFSSLSRPHEHWKPPPKSNVRARTHNLASSKANQMQKKKIEVPKWCTCKPALESSDKSRTSLPLSDTKYRSVISPVILRLRLNMGMFLSWFGSVLDFFHWVRSVDSTLTLGKATEFVRSTSCSTLSTTECPRYTNTYVSAIRLSCPSTDTV